MLTETKKQIDFVYQEIDTFKLDLRDRTIYTEAASGNYKYTPIIAALAGGKVFALAKNYYDPRDIINIGKKLGVHKQINIVFNKYGDHINECDIITNSGLLRPIDKKMISKMKSTASICLMFETWQYNSNYLDLDYCKSKGIFVVGTNEEQKELNLFKSIPFKILKILFDNGFSIYKDNILIMSSGKIGLIIDEMFKKMELHFDQYIQSEEYLDPIPDEILKNYDVIILAEYYNKINLLSQDGFIQTSKLKRINPNCLIIYTNGNINMKDVYQDNINIFPKNMKKITADYLGYKPVIDLNIAGLKVGEIVSRLRAIPFSIKDIIEKVKATPEEHQYIDFFK